ncbi:oxygen-independent coproporphyrinogen III oxidase [Endozoicomonadaceae bacterium StTr2]
MYSVIQCDTEMLKKYDIAGPRYTSYPTAIQFSPQFTETDYRQEIEASNQSSKPLSLYFHIPFCSSLCFFCACNKIITHTKARSVPYLERLHKEIALQAELISASRQVNQLHFGGGTPTFISDEQLYQLLQVTGQHFNLAPVDQREFSIEVDPRAVRPETIPMLREFGFNRISFGVQDLDEKVQEAVNRKQSLEQNMEVVEAARSAGYQSINMDIIYGLPHQTLDSFSHTLDVVISMRPERLAIYNYAHLPHRIKAQKLIKQKDLPSPVTKLALLELTINRLQEAGYVFIGMDHFALPEDELVKAMEQGTLQRNFQGYSTHADTDMVGMGMTSIGKTDNCYSQNQRYEKAYFQDIDDNKLAIMQGYQLTPDDKLRREVIQHIMCEGIVDFPKLDQMFGIEFTHYFAEELRLLKPMEEDALVQVGDQSITVLPFGRLLLRNIAMVFDLYRPRYITDQLFSRVI